MTLFKNQLFALLILLHVAPAQSGTVGRFCEEALNKTTVVREFVNLVRKAQRPVWESNFSEAAKAENPLPRLYSFLRLIELSYDELNISSHELDSIKKIRKTLEVTDVKFKKDARQYSIRKSAQRSHGASQFAVTGASLTTLHVRGMLDSLRGFFWAVGPGVFRTVFFLNSGLKDIDFDNLKISAEKALINKEFLERLAAIASLEPQTVAMLLDKDIGQLLVMLKPQLVHSQNEWRNSRIGWSLMWSALTIGATDQAPLDVVSAPFNSTIYDVDYLQKIEKNVSPIQGHVLILYAENIFPRIDNREAPPLATTFGRYLQSTGKSIITTRKLTEASAHEVLKDMEKFDSVIIFAHGNADRIDFSAKTLQTMKSYQLKEGAALIFVSCLVGQKGQTDPSTPEMWTQLSDAMLNGGKAVVSTQILTTGIDISAAGAATKDFSFLKTLKSKARKFYFQQSGLGLYSAARSHLDAQDYIYRNEVGYRVYDDETNEVQYISITK